jgi:amino acid transporter
MASRILYGLAAQGLLPAWLARVNARTRTPVAATAVSGGIVLALALPLGIAVLAQATSAITLTVFACVNLALWRLKGREPGPSEGWTVPRWVPAIGFLITGGFLIAEGVRLVAG